jgi:hypothetical protein
MRLPDGTGPYRKERINTPAGRTSRHRATTFLLIEMHPYRRQHRNFGGFAAFC